MKSPWNHYEISMKSPWNHPSLIQASRFSVQKVQRIGVTSMEARSVTPADFRSRCKFTWVLQGKPGKIWKGTSMNLYHLCFIWEIHGNWVQMEISSGSIQQILGYSKQVVSSDCKTTLGWWFVSGVMYIIQ